MAISNTGTLEKVMKRIMWWEKEDKRAYFTAMPEKVRKVSPRDPWLKCKWISVNRGPAGRVCQRWTEWSPSGWQFYGNPTRAPTADSSRIFDGSCTCPRVRWTTSPWTNLSLLCSERVGSIVAMGDAGTLLNFRAWSWVVCRAEDSSPATRSMCKFVRINASPRTAEKGESLLLFRLLFHTWRCHPNSMSKFSDLSYSDPTFSLHFPTMTFSSPTFQTRHFHFTFHSRH